MAAPWTDSSHFALYRGFCFTALRVQQVIDQLAFGDHLSDPTNKACFQARECSFKKRNLKQSF